MRFMLLVKGSDETEAGVMPTEQELAEMTAFNEQLVKSGVMLAGEGLHPSSNGARVTFSDKVPTVVDGPFAEAKELVAGFWVLEVGSREEAVEWARRVPFTEGEIEVRQVFSTEDFGDALTPELREAEDRMRAQVEEQQAAKR